MGSQVYTWSFLRILQVLFSLFALLVKLPLGFVLGSAWNSSLSNASGTTQSRKWLEKAALSSEILFSAILLLPSSKLDYYVLSVFPDSFWRELLSSTTLSLLEVEGFTFSVQLQFGEEKCSFSPLSVYISIDFQNTLQISWIWSPFIFHSLIFNIENVLSILLSNLSAFYFIAIFSIMVKKMFCTTTLHLFFLLVFHHFFCL